MSLNQKFINWEQASRDIIDVKRIYIDMAEDLVSGIMLSQIVYWFLPNRHGSSKTRINKDGEYWIAKTYDDWFQECRISRKQAMACIEHLVKLELIVTAVFHFGGRRMMHLRINPEVFMEKFSRLVNNLDDPEYIKAYWNEIKEADKRTNASKMVTSQNGNIPKREDVCSQKGKVYVPNMGTSYTKTNIETTTKTTNAADAATGTAMVKTESPLVASDPSAKEVPLVTQKGDVTRLILELLPRAAEADSYVHEVRYKSNGDPVKSTIEDPTFTFREGKLFTVIKEAINLIASGVVNWSMEGKYLRELVQMYTREGKFTYVDIIECLAWAYHTEQFDFYKVSSLSVPKLMPKFLDIKRTGRLKESLQMKPKFETAGQRTERIYNELENETDEQRQERAHFAKEYAERTGVKKPARI